MEGKAINMICLVKHAAKQPSRWIQKCMSCALLYILYVLLSHSCLHIYFAFPYIFYFDYPLYFRRISHP